LDSNATVVKGFMGYIVNIRFNPALRLLVKTAQLAQTWMKTLTVAVEMGSQERLVRLTSMIAEKISV
jgi:hypothetical protein